MNQYHVKFLIRYYNILSEKQAEKIEDISGPALQLLILIPYQDLIRPLILLDREMNGLSLQQLSLRYNVPKGFCQSVCRGAALSS